MGVRWSKVCAIGWLASRRGALIAVTAAAVCLAACAQRDPAATQVARRLLAVDGADAADAIAGEAMEHFVLDIDESELRKLESTAGAADREMLADPTAAAVAFGSALGMPAATRYELLERSPQPEEGAGAYLATYRASNDGGVVLLRLISQPDAAGRPTFWVLNDVERLTVGMGNDE